MEGFSKVSPQIRSRGTPVSQPRRGTVAVQTVRAEGVVMGIAGGGDPGGPVRRDRGHRRRRDLVFWQRPRPGGRCHPTLFVLLDGVQMRASPLANSCLNAAPSGWELRRNNQKKLAGKCVRFPFLRVASNVSEGRGILRTIYAGGEQSFLPSPLKRVYSRFVVHS